MTLPERIRKIFDTIRPNRYALRAYLVRDGRTHPFAVICPGGAYRKVCSYVEGMPFARELNRRGYHAVVVYYRVREKARYPNPHEDLKRGIEEILSHEKDWRLDTEGWSLWGSSAGGHLAASYCTLKLGTPSPAALILVYPVVTMGEKTHTETRSNLLGENADPEMVEMLSVEKNISPGFPPTFVWYGTADTSVDPANSLMLQRALERADVPCIIEAFQGIPHGAGLAKGTAAEVWLDDAVGFWEDAKNLWI